MTIPVLQFSGRKQRHAIMGRTGSGKTVFGAHVLSHAAFDKQPYVIVDYKGDELLNQIPYVEEIGYSDVPKHPGLYIIHPRVDQPDDMEKFLWRIWEKENTGLFIDEAYMMPKSGPAHHGAYTALLTQGRSKRIPMINLTQRPKMISNFVFTESDFFSVFHLQWKDDVKKAMEFVPVDLERELPDFHSWYHSVPKRTTFGLLPSPDEDTILNRFDVRLAPKRRFL